MATVEENEEAGSVVSALPNLTGKRHLAHSGPVEHRSQTRRKINFPDGEDAVLRNAALLQASWALLLLAWSEARATTAVFDVIEPSSRSRLEKTDLSSTIHQRRLSILTENGQARTVQDVLRLLENSCAGDMMRPRVADVVTSTLLDLSCLQEPGLGGFPRSEEGGGLGTPYDVILRAVPNDTQGLTLDLESSVARLDEAAANSCLHFVDFACYYMTQNLAVNFHPVLSHVDDDAFSIERPKDQTENQCSSLQLLQSQFECHARKNPKDIALCWVISIEPSLELLEWSYATLDSHACRVCNVLLAHVARFPTRIVPVSMERCAEMYAAILGILKAGFAWCPIDVLSPFGRRCELIERTGSKLVLTAQVLDKEDHGSMPSGIDVLAVSDILAVRSSPVKASTKPTNLELEPSFSGDVLTTRESKSEASPSNVKLGRSGLLPQDMAYLIWTSGTTGPPKGVAVSHDAAVRSMQSLQKGIVGPNGEFLVPRCVQFSQNTFDVFVQDLFYTWGLGGTLIAASRQLMTGSFSQLCSATLATHAHLTPAFAARVPRASCPSLRVVTMIGEKLPQDVADDWGRDCAAYNTYGPAEAAVVATVQPFSGPLDPFKSSMIGRPLPSVGFAVMRDGRPVTRGCTGELALIGPQLADGYHADPLKTRQRFVDNLALGQRLYMTGDIVRLLPNGLLEFLGRQDDMIKLNGIRVELSEISYAIKPCHKAVKDVVTCYFSHSDRPSKVLVAFLSNDEANTKLPGREEQASSIICDAQSYSAAVLPGYMQPQVFILIRTIPQTASAKTDLKKLQEIYNALDVDGHEKGSNESEVHSWHDAGNLQPQELDRLLSLLGSLAGTKKSALRPSQQLTSIGIDSLQIMMLSRALQDAGFSFKTADIVCSRTISDVVRAVVFGQESVSVDSLPRSLIAFNEQWHPSISRLIGSPDIFVCPVTPLQDSLLAATTQTRQAYWSHHFFQLPRDISLDGLHKAWQIVQDRTEALRTTFVLRAETNVAFADPYNSAFVQIIHERAKLDWTVVACEGESWTTTAKQRANAIPQAHSLQNWRVPPWAISILQTRTAPVLMITLHHSLHDATSITHMLRMVESVYIGKQQENNGAQLRQALGLLLPNQDDDMKTFWAGIFQDHEMIEESQWPDLTASRIEAEAGIPMHATKLKLTVSIASLKATAKQNSVSASSIIRTAVGYILSAILETPAVTFGESVSERHRDLSLSNTVAPLVSVIPVPFRRGQQIDEDVRKLDVIFQEIRRQAAPSTPGLRKLLHRRQDQPLYPAVFAYHFSEGWNDTRLPSATWRPLKDVIGPTVEHPLAVNVYDDTELLRFEVFAHPLLVGQVQLDVFAAQLDHLIEAMVAGLDQSWEQVVESLPQNLRSQASSTLPMQRDDLPACDPCYWLGSLTDTHPEWPAVEIADPRCGIWEISGRWTFAELHDETQRVAKLLFQQYGQGCHIAVCLGRTLQSYAILLGIFMSGNVYLPLDETLPNQRKQFLVRDSACKVVLTDRPADFQPAVDQQQNDVHGHDVLDITAANWEYDLWHVSPEIELPVPDCDSDAYLLYTSGSTGKPKGVLVSRRNLCNFVEGLANLIETSSSPGKLRRGEGKFLGLASRAFDVHLCEMFLGWRLGLCAVTADRDALLSDLKNALTGLDVTHACFVPSLLEQADISPSDIPQMVYFSVGGEKISPGLLDTWSRQRSILVVNAYGPTELTIGCCASPLTTTSTTRAVGRPFGNSDAWVLEPESLRQTLRGQLGELCFTGDLVATGYFNRAEAQGFVANFHGSRMYRTGDMARMMPDGSIEYLGRRDDQAKIRGQRIELGEVTEALRLSTQESMDVAVLLLQHPEIGRVQLVAFLAPTASLAARKDIELRMLESFSDNCEMAREHCQKSLPSFMVPDFVLPVTVVPLAANSGKADSKLLKHFFSSCTVKDLLQRPSIHGPKLNRPLTTLETSIVECIAHLLDKPDLVANPDTSIFELGLDSLTAIGLAHRLKGQDLHCSVSDILSHATVSRLAHFLQSSAQDSVSPADADDTELQRFNQRALQSLSFEDSQQFEAAWPCLPVQEDMVAGSINALPQCIYVQRMTFELHPDIDLSRLKDAWTRMMYETPILRTCFAEHDGSIVQLLMRPTAISLPWVAVFQGKSRADIPAENLGCLPSESHPILGDIIKSIDKIPPWRLQLVHLSSKRFLHLYIHHALYDGVSLQLLLTNVSCYFLQRTATPVTSMSTILKLFLDLKKTEQRNFWTRYFVGYSDKSRRAEPRTRDLHNEQSSPSSTLFTKTLTPGLDKLQAAAARYGVSLATFLEAAFAVILGNILESGDICFGSILSGRTSSIENADTVCGPCIATVPRRYRLADHSSFAALAHASQNANSNLLRFQHTRLRDIRHWLKADRRLFDHLFTFLPWDEEDEVSDVANGYPWIQRSSTMAPDYPFNIEFQVRKRQQQIRVVIASQPQNNEAYAAEGVFEQLDLFVSSLVIEDNIPLQVQMQDEIAVNRTDADFVDDTAWSPLQETVRRVVAGLCKLNPLSLSKSASFFQYGIDSIMTIALARKIREAGVETSSGALLAHPSISNFCDYLQSEDSDPLGVTTSGGHEMDLPNPGGNFEAVYYCTPLQSSMIHSTLASEGSLYVHHHVMRLSALLAIDQLKDAWSQVVARYDILRTSFGRSESDDRWMALVSSHPTVDVEILKKQDFPTAARTIVAMTTMKSEADFRRPPFRITIVKDRDHPRLVLTIHHSLYDGISIRQVFAAFEDAYSGRIVDRPPPFSRCVKAAAPLRPAAVEYWVRTLRSYESISLPAREDKTSSSIIHQTHASTLGTGYLDQIRHLSVTPQAVCLLAFAKTLFEIVGRRDVVFGLVLSGRSIPVTDAEDVVGPLFNTVPFRVRLENVLESNQTALQNVQTQLQLAHEHQLASLQHIQSQWRQSASGSKAQLFDALFVFQRNDGSLFPGHGLWTLEEWPFAAAGSEYLLNLEVDQSPKGLHLQASCSSVVFSTAALRARLEQFDAIVMDIITHPDRPALAFPSRLAQLPLSLPEGLKPDFTAVDEDQVRQLRKFLAAETGIAETSIHEHTSIFTLGLDSIRAIKFAAVCRKQGIPVSVADVVQGETPSGISQRLQARNSSVNRESHSAQESATKMQQHDLREEFEDIYPCLPGQVYHLAAWQQSKQSIFCPVWVFESAQGLDCDRLEGAWHALREHHPILRTSFVLTASGEVLQEVWRSSMVPYAFAEIDLRCETRSNVIHMQLTNMSNYDFDLRSPPVRLMHARHSEGDLILLQIHHALYDAMSLPLMMRDLEMLYLGKYMTDQLRSFAAFARHQAVVESDPSFWKQQLAQATPTLLATDPSEASGKTKLPKQLFSVATCLQGRLEEMSKKCSEKGHSITSLVVAAFSRVLSRQIGSSNPIFGVYHLGRSSAWPEIDGLAAPCLNVLPMVVSDPWSSPPSTLLDRIRKALAARISREQANLITILQSSDHGHSPIFNTYLNILWKHGAGSEWQDKALFRPLDVGLPTNFLRSEPANCATAIDESKWPLPSHGLWMDVTPTADGKSLKVAARAQALAMEEKELEGFLRGFGDELADLSSSLAEMV